MLFDAPPYEYPFIDPVLIFAFVMFLVALVPIIADTLKAPRIVFYIIAGAIAGPHVLNFLHRNETMELLGTVGLLYLIFLAGIQMDLNKFIKYKYQSLSFGIITFMLPFILGTSVGLFLGYSLSSSLLLASLFASHTLIAYPIISRLKLVKNKAMTTAVGGIIVTDPGALLILAVVVGAHSGDLSMNFWLLLSVLVAVYLIIMFFIVPIIGQWFFRNSKSGGAVEYGFVIAILFLCAYLADVAGLEPIIGAFLAGLALNRLIPEDSVLMNRTKFVGDALFIPIFLLTVGMLVDLSAFVTDFYSWVIAGVMTLCVLVGKGAAAYISKYLFHFSNDEAWTVYGLTIPQAAATLAVTLIAYDMELFDDYILNGTVMMILITCIIGPYLVEKFGKKVAMAEEREPYDPSSAPQRIMVPLANPETSDALMDIAFMVRKPDSDQPIYPLTVAMDGPDMEANVERSEKMLSHAVIHAASAEVPVNPVTRIDINVAHGISRGVKEKRISNVVIGWNGRVSTTRRIFGSVLDQLMKDVDVMMMVCKIEKPANTFQRLIVAVPPLANLEVGFLGAIKPLKMMAEKLGVQLIVVSTEDQQSVVQESFEQIQPELTTLYESLDRWSKLPAWLQENNKEGDLFVLISAREGSLSWRPALDRLPRVIAQRYPRLSFITVYPSEVEMEETMVAGGPDFNILKKDRIKVQLKDENIETALRDLIQEDEALQGVKLDRIIHRLLKNSAGYSPEVMPGVFLYEAHTSKVPEQMLFIGVAKNGVNVEQTAHQGHVILVLLSPKECSSQDHLRVLNSIVKLIRPGEGLNQVKGAKTIQEVVNALRSR